MQTQRHSDSLPILVAEDNSAQREAIQLILAKNGYRVVGASSGVEALKKLEEGHFDITILDVLMPGMDGFEVCSRMRQNGLSKDTYAIFVSGLGHSKDRVKGLEVGADDYIVKPFFARELLARVRQGEKSIRQRRELERLSVRDPLTGLFNRRHLDRKLDEEFERFRRYGRPFSIAIVDIDDFKKVNDRFGHDVGDNVLKTIGEALKTKARKSDTPVRYGGEEFILILPELGLQKAALLGERLCQQVRSLNFGGPSTSFSVTVSVGVASSSAKSYSHWREIIMHADLALYAAKASGKNCVRVADARGQRA